MGVHQPTRGLSNQGEGNGVDPTSLTFPGISKSNTSWTEQGDTVVLVGLSQISQLSLCALNLVSIRGRR